MKENPIKYNVTEAPQNWVILKLPDNLHKIFATWSGGYLDGDRWKLNSGITKVEEDDDFYYFFGFSGSCYKCHKKKYGITNAFGLSILNALIEQKKGEVKIIEDADEWIDSFDSLS